MLALSLLCLLMPVRAQEGELPEPRLMGQSDSLSLVVVRARSEDAGFRQMLSTALQGAQKSPSGSLAGLLSSFLSLRSQEEMVLSALPLQWVRVDRVGPDGKLLSNVAVTLKGWRGFQSLLYNALADGPDGKPYETRSYGGEEIVLRSGWQNPANRMVLSRVHGTFLNCPSPDEARYLIDRLSGKDQHALSGPLWLLWQHTPQDQDACGAIVNQQGMLQKTLDWVNPLDTARVREAVGAERLEQAIGLVQSVWWQADVVSDDQIDIVVRFQTAGKEQAEQVGAVVEQAREVLEAGGRMGDFYLTIQPDGLKVGFSMLGFRDRVGRFLGTVRI